VSVFRENTVVLNRLAKTTDLLSHVVARAKHFVKSHWDFVVLIGLA